MDFHLIDTIYGTIDSPSRIEEVGIETKIEESYEKEWATARYRKGLLRSK